LIEHIVNIASSMRYELIAEGIEHEYQMHYLLAHGVRLGQGWHFAKPMSAADFMTFIQKQNA
jgi:sensor c-di-GMP phosphodiesterase-like protein